MPTPKEQALAMVPEMTVARKNAFNLHFPVLESKDYPNEESYRKALLDQYVALRMEHYDSLCLSRGLSAYADNIENNPNRMNIDAWQPGRSGLPSDSVYTRKPNVSSYTPSRAATCALTAHCIEADVCERMGLGANSFVPSSGVNNISAAGFFDTLKPTKYVTGDRKNLYPLWDLIEQGRAGPGAVVSTPSPGNGGSGFHARTLIAVEYNDDGTLRSYTLQGTNSTSLEVVTSREQGHKRCAVSNMDQWMQEQVQAEVQRLSDKPTNEIQSSVSQERGTIICAIDDLGKQETRVFEQYGVHSFPLCGERRDKGKNVSNHIAAYAAHYAGELSRMGNQNGTKNVMKLDRQRYEIACDARQHASPLTPTRTQTSQHKAQTQQRKPQAARRQVPTQRRSSSHSR